MPQQAPAGSAVRLSGHRDRSPWRGGDPAEPWICAL